MGRCILRLHHTPDLAEGMVRMMISVGVSKGAPPLDRSGWAVRA